MAEHTAEPGPAESRSAGPAVRVAARPIGSATPAVLDANVNRTSQGNKAFPLTMVCEEVVGEEVMGEEVVGKEVVG